jgi:FkbM family methyltransferase
MELHKPSLANRWGKRAAKPLSRVTCSELLYAPSRMFDAYLNFLHGKGSGAGWDLHEEVGAAVRLIQNKQPVLFDVGANVGDWSAAMVQAIPEATVFMFEPSPGCQAEIRRKSIPKSKLFPCAIGEVAGELPLFVSSETDASASLHARRDTPFGERTYRETAVPVRTLDEIIESGKIATVDFMKMDIEGHELFALRGAEKSLAGGKIRALSFEFGAGNINSRTFFHDYWDFFEKIKFDLFRITPGGRNVPITSYYEDLEYFRGVSNFLAVRRPRA